MLCFFFSSLAADPSMLCVGISLTLNCSMKIKRSGFFHRTTMNLHSTTRAENPHTQHRVICWPSSMCVMLVLKLKKKKMWKFPLTRAALQLCWKWPRRQSKAAQHQLLVGVFYQTHCIFKHNLRFDATGGNLSIIHTSSLSSCYRKKRAMQSIYRIREVRVEIELD